MSSVLVDAGLRKGDRVAAQAAKTPETVCLYLACLASGLCYVPLATGCAEAETACVLEDTAPAAFIGSGATISAVERSGMPRGTKTFSIESDGTGTLADMAARAGEGAPGVPLSGRDPAAILYTSGTTGRPKGAVLTHSNLIHSTRSLATAWKISRDDVVLNVLPTFHAHGLLIALGPALSVGAETIFISDYTNEEVIRHLSESTVFMGVPAFYERLLSDVRLGAELVSNMRLFTCGSAPLPAAVHRRFFSRTGHAILERYGTTEAMVVASNPLEGERVAGTVGFPLPGIDVEIRDADGRRLAPGGIGELVLRGPNLFGGYFGVPRSTAAEFTNDGYFRTGDLASISADGRLTIVGRAKDIIISGGYSIHPMEVEEALRRIDCVQDAAVFGVPHPEFGEGVVAAVEIRSGRALPSPNELRRKLSPGLARHKIPRVYIPLPNLPRSPLGKTLKAELRDIYGEAFGRTVQTI